MKKEKKKGTEKFDINHRKQATVQEVCATCRTLTTALNWKQHRKLANGIKVSLFKVHYFEKKKWCFISITRNTAFQCGHTS